MGPVSARQEWRPSPLDVGQSAPDQAFLRELMRVIGHRNRGRELLAVLNYLDRVFAGTKDPAIAFGYVGAFADGLQRADVPLALFQSKLQPILERAATEVRNGRSPEPLRVQAIELLGLTASTSETMTLLMSLVGSGQPHGVETAAVSSLSRMDDPSIARQLLARWSGFTPVLRRQLLPILLSRPDRATSLIEAIKAGTVLRTELTPTQIAGLRAHRSAAVRALAAGVFEQAAPNDRGAVIQRYVAALDLRGNAARGQTTYTARCAVCHQPGQDGYAVGPAVEALKVFGKDELLTHLVDPNRTIDARYRLYQVDVADGASVTGIIQNESQNSVTVRPPFGASQTVPRPRIARLLPLDRSMMPDGLEEGLSLQDMADLLEFLRGPAEGR